MFSVFEAELYARVDSVVARKGTRSIHASLLDDERGTVNIVVAGSAVIGNIRGQGVYFQVCLRCG